ncbi:MAG: PorV/PorQ family protein [Candidatus Eisenbacteria bacterium]|nr:PorV/PorQ family protein [Candidatus Eisenbacteria bacterium]
MRKHIASLFLSFGILLTGIISILLLAVSPAELLAQTNLGGQRSGTSSGTFLKIPVGARASAMGGVFVAIADDASDMSWNVGGLTNLTKPEVLVTRIEWPADIIYDYVSIVYPVISMNSAFGIQAGTLRTDLLETTEYYPYGTGRTFGFNDTYVGIGFARRFTDKLSIGVGAKYLIEELGTEVGGPTSGAWLLDVGTAYRVGFQSLRMAIVLSNFGPQLRPSGSYDFGGRTFGYQSFSPPTTFKFGAAMDLLQNSFYRLTSSVELHHPADNAETIKAGGELTFSDNLAFRAGYDFNSDTPAFSFGGGIKAGMGFARGSVDYAFRDAGLFGKISQFSVSLSF